MYRSHPSTKGAESTDEKEMTVLAVILARAGSKGVPRKCLQPLLGRPLIEYTLDHALAARTAAAVVLSTDCEEAAQLARCRGIETIDRPPALATDEARIDAALRHAVETWESRHARRIDAAVLLMGNVPVRAPGIIDRCVEHWRATGCDSVRTVAPVGRHHPDWLFRLEGDRMTPYRPNAIARRQDLEPLFGLDGSVYVVSRAALVAAAGPDADAQAYLGNDRRAIAQPSADTIDIDEPVDLAIAAALLQSSTRPARRRPPLAIDGRGIGPRCRPYVIAEAGVNHDGSIDDALQLVDAAVAAGADAVKFQIFRADALTTADAPTADYQKPAGGDSQRDMLRRLELSAAEFRRIRDHCDARGIDFIATPFSESDVRTLAELRPVAVKIASTDLNNVPLLRAALSLELPVIASTGASTAEEIASAVARFRRWNVDDRVVILHCVSAYPTPLADANLAAIRTLAARFGLPTGFSDHTRETITAALAAAAGACVLEKHFTLDGRRSGPDHAISLEPSELAEYVRLARTGFDAQGTGEPGLCALETSVRSVAGKSLVAARDLPAGTVLSAADISAKRPAGGIAPSRIDELIGRELARPVSADEQIGWETLRPLPAAASNPVAMTPGR